jgi:hypothetical protein
MVVFEPLIIEVQVKCFTMFYHFNAQSKEPWLKGKSHNSFLTFPLSGGGIRTLNLGIVSQLLYYFDAQSKEPWLKRKFHYIF